MQRDLSKLLYIGNDQVTVSEFRFIDVGIVRQVHNFIRCFYEIWDFSELSGDFFQHEPGGRNDSQVYLGQLKKWV